MILVLMIVFQDVLESDSMLYVVESSFWHKCLPNFKLRDSFATVSGNTLAVAVRPANAVITEKKQLVKQRRVVVTGMGVVTPIGDNPDVFYDNLLEGVSGISEIQSFDCSSFPTVHISFLLISRLETGCL